MSGGCVYYLVESSEVESKSLKMLFLCPALLFSELPDYMTSDGHFSHGEQFSSSMAITSVISLDGNRTFVDTGFLTAFVNGEVRGASQTRQAVPFGPFKGTFTFDILVFASETASDENIGFQYQVEDGEPIGLLETIEFVKDEKQGNHMAPFFFSPGGEGGTGPMLTEMCVGCHATILEMGKAMAGKGLPSSDRTASDVSDAFDRSPGSDTFGLCASLNFRT